MERAARPATVADLKLLIKALNDEGVEYLLIGAYALFALGYQRATAAIDLLFNACGETYASLLPHAVTVDLDGIPVRTLDLAGMLKTKQSGRDKDRMDRFALERAIAEQAPKK